MRQKLRLPALNRPLVLLVAYAEVVYVVLICAPDPVRMYT